MRVVDRGGQPALPLVSPASGGGETAGGEAGSAGEADRPPPPLLFHTTPLPQGRGFGVRTDRGGLQALPLTFPASGGAGSAGGEADRPPLPLSVPPPLPQGGFPVWTAGPGRATGPPPRLPRLRRGGIRPEGTGEGRSSPSSAALSLPLSPSLSAWKRKKTYRGRRRDDGVADDGWWRRPPAVETPPPSSSAGCASGREEEEKKWPKPPLPHPRTIVFKPWGWQITNLPPPPLHPLKRIQCRGKIVFSQFPFFI